MADITFEKIGEVVLHLEKYSGQDSYSDGPIEDELLDIAKNVKPEDIDETIDQKAQWPVLYHFSAQRENIVKWLPINKSHKVLEIGSGCGAITGALCSMAGSVTGVDLSKKRSTINAYRHKDCDNLEIHVGNFLDIEPDLPDDFDYICLIGVFEYGQSYMGCDKPFHRFLEIIKKHVKSDGRIVIAIENKMGLKYFAGCREDHLGTYFSGIEGYPKGGYVRTFSRNGLEKLFNECGLNQYEFYYPYPDYKFPTTVFSDKRLPKKSELTNNLRNFDRERLLLFDEKNAFDSIIEDGLFPVFSNSYLAIIGPAVNTGFSRFSNERKREYAIRTEMYFDGGNIIVAKVPDDEKAYGHISGLKESHDKLCEKYKGSGLTICPVELEKDSSGRPAAKFDFIEGRTLSEILDDYLKNNDTEGFISCFKEFIKRIDCRPDYPFNNRDLVFSNIIVSEDKWTVIDYEWTADEHMDINETALRALYCYLKENDGRSDALPEECYTLVGASQNVKEEFERKEVLFHKNVQDGHFSLAQLREEIGAPVIHPEKYLGSNSYSERVERVQIYPDRGAGYSEEDSYFVKKADFDNGTLCFETKFTGDVKNIRIDPMMEAGVVFIDEITINEIPLPSLSKKYIECNGRRLRGNAPGYVFDTEDPNINIHLDSFDIKEENLLKVQIRYAYMNKELAGGILSAVKRVY